MKCELQSHAIFLYSSAAGEVNMSSSTLQLLHICIHVCDYPGTRRDAQVFHKRALVKNVLPSSREGGVDQLSMALSGRRRRLCRSPSRLNPLPSLHHCFLFASRTFLRAINISWGRSSAPKVKNKDIFINHNSVTCQRERILEAGHPMILQTSLASDTISPCSMKK